MNYARLVRFARQHGSLSFTDTTGRDYQIPGGGLDSQRLAEEADRFLWDGLWRSRGEMQGLVEQSERGLAPGCQECERLERLLISARDRDRQEGNVEGRYEIPALQAFQDHRGTHL
jgi:hypothetical protein